MTKFGYNRRKTTPVHIGQVTIGADNDIAVQSMTNTPTLDTDSSAAQILRIADAGAHIVRLTAQTPAHARNLSNIKEQVRAAGCQVPLVADIHFTPEAAFVAAERVEKVRINPGNFVDPGRTFKHIEYTDTAYAAELQRIADKLVPLLDICKKHGTALRIGVNHGSLSDRIMSRYGNTPAGMVESAMEFLRICRDQGFTDVVVSIKASNVTVMVETVRLMARTMDSEGMHFPLHLGVTEAGDGEDGRVKSAVGIGTLLSEGIGDTIRVSLSEDPECEVPVARALLKHVDKMRQAPEFIAEVAPDFNFIAPDRRISTVVEAKTATDNDTLKIGGGNIPVVVGLDLKPEEIPAGVKVLEAKTTNAPAEIKAQVHQMIAQGETSPVIVKLTYPESMDADEVTIAAACDLGAILLSGFGDGIWIDAPGLEPAKVKSLSLGILQAVRLRISRTEYIACPSCGRTLFDLPTALAQVREATSHLPGLKIAVMGCIVNGPGEMADADYGYVGAGPGNVSLYKGKECVVKNIPAEGALDLLIQLIKDNGDWTDGQ